MLVKDIMDTSVITIRIETTFEELLALMYKYHITEFPVIDNHFKLRGMLYERDVMQLLYPGYVQLTDQLPEVSKIKDIIERVKDTPVRKIMTRDVETVTPDTDALRAGTKMLASQIDRIPVVDDDYKIIGTLNQNHFFVALIRLSTEAAPSLTHFDSKKIPKTEQSSEKERTGKERRLFERHSIMAILKISLRPCYMNLEYSQKQNSPGQIRTAVDFSL